MGNAEIGIIGGSGFYQMELIDSPEYLELDTPFGKPSEKILLGNIKNRSVAFISRHGKGHRNNPSEVNYRANLFAMKMLNVKQLISVSACGSLAEKYRPSDLVIPDQFVDNTFKRDKTYFEKGIAVHVSMADPFCPYLSDLAFKAAKQIGITVHKGGTYFNMEGPQFSSKGESNLYRKMGFSIIGMTQAIEAKLARELEICFVPLSFVTDYDCWHHEEEAVSVEMVIKILMNNAQNAEKLIEHFIDSISRARSECECSHALENSIITNPDLIPAETYKRLEPLLGKYLKRRQQPEELKQDK